MEHVMTYISSLVMCLIFTAVLFGFNVKNWKAHLLNPLSMGYILTMLSLIADCIWILIDRKPQFIILNYVVNGIEYCSLGWIGACWLLYCFDAFPLPFCKKKMTKMVALIPICAVSILILTAYWNHWIYLVDGEGVYQRGPYFFFQYTGFAYIVVASFLALICRRRVHLSSEKEKFMVMALFALPSLVLGSVQMLALPGGLPTLQFSVVLALLIVYACDQNRKVTRDNLTNLMNRYEFERILDDRMGHFKRESQNHLFVIIGDLDRFKEINDNYGHMTGDRVLQYVSDALDSVSQHYCAEVARMAGDEFLALVEAENMNAAQQFCSDVTTELDKISANYGMEVSMSMGISQYDGEMTILEFLGAADRELYKIKQKKKTAIR